VINDHKTKPRKEYEEYLRKVDLQHLKKTAVEKKMMNPPSDSDIDVSSSVYV
jgi:hypothetical protein